jgi:hypothetical protein
MATARAPWRAIRFLARANEEDRMGQPSNRTIVGVAVVLFSGVLLGVSIHHLVATGTCSSTGYSRNYGPVPYCPSGTGWWMLFLFAGIIGSIVGGFVSGGSSVGLINGGIFTAIGLGSLSLLFDSSAHSGTKVFAGIFGGCFAVAGLGIDAFVVAAAFRGMSSSRGSSSRSRSGSRLSSVGAGGTTSAFGTPQSTFAGTSGASAFGTPDKNADPILGAYAASSAATVTPASIGLSGSIGGSPSAASPDLDSIAKLADLHKKGALTDEEFAREKAKLLGT